MELLAKDPDERIRNTSVLARRLEAMEHGLLRRAEREQARGSASDDFDVDHEGSGKTLGAGGESSEPPAASADASIPRDVANAAAETLSSTSHDSASVQVGENGRGTQDGSTEEVDDEADPVSALRHSMIRWF